MDRGTPLDGRVALITGGGSGIGLAIARKFALAGCRLVICGRNPERLDRAAGLLGEITPEVLTVVADVSQEPDVIRLFEQLDRSWGRIDILVNNAGAFDGGPFESLTLAAWENVLGGCLTGTFLCSREAFRRMKVSGGGRILNIGSISAQRPRENAAPYAAAKFGVWGLTQSIALDGRPYGIVCSCLHPGNVLVERRQTSGLEADEEPMMHSEVIADAAFAMINLPPDINFLEAIVLPASQAYLGRG
ncbi:SDR family NAD(P)-dependent oxidoreductase [bacterium]|nr:SDR family NAD(P)-dependent oxidoreductase [bacterium]